MGEGEPNRLDGGQDDDGDCGRPNRTRFPFGNLGRLVGQESPDSHEQFSWFRPGDCRVRRFHVRMRR